MKNLFFLITCLFVVLTHIVCVGSAATKENVTFQDKLIYEGKELVLNGLGVRKATFLKVRVYVGGLYVDSKSKESPVILSAPNPKLIIMSFVRDVSKSKLIQAWEEGFESALGKEEKEKQMNSIEKFYDLMKDIEKGEQVKIGFLDKGVQVTFNQEYKGLIGDKSFAKALLSIWFINPRDKGLRSTLR